MAHAQHAAGVGSVLTFVPFEGTRSLALGAATRPVAMVPARSPSPPPTPAYGAAARGSAGGRGSLALRVPSPATTYTSTGTGTPAAPPAPAPASPAAATANGHARTGSKLHMSAPRRVALAQLLSPGSAASRASLSTAAHADDEGESSASASASSPLLPPGSTPVAGPPSRKGKEKAGTTALARRQEEGSDSEEGERGATPVPAASASGTPKATPKANGKLVNGTTPTASPLANSTVRGTPLSALVNGTTPKGTPVNGTPNGTPKKQPKTAATNGTADASGTPKSKAKSKDKDPRSGVTELDMSWPAPFAGGHRAAGLHNGSMACYTNATLQVLLHTPPVLRVALEHNPSTCFMRASKKFCMTCAIREIATKEHWSGKRAYRPLAVHQNLSQIKKGFSRNRQEDAHEFFRFVTDAFQNTALGGKPKDLPEKEKRKTWVYRLWGGQVRSRVLCLSCRKPSDTFDSFLDLSLDMPNKRSSLSLADLFKIFCHEDRLDGDNKYNCENCKKKSAATKSMRIAEAPPVLTLHLKRFGYSLSWPSRMTKVNSLVDYPQKLDIAPYLIEGKEGSGTQYRLYAVTCHHGSSLHYGHYTSYVVGPDGRWYNADDDDVSPVNAKTVLQDKSAYLLSYMRIPSGTLKATAATAAATASAISSPNSFKRRREDESPSPQKRPPGPARASLGSAYGAGSSTGKELSVLAKLYGDSDAEAPSSDSDAPDDPISRALHQPRPRTHAMALAGASPISRATNPGGPASGSASGPRKSMLNGKYHRANPKAGIEALRGASGPPSAARRHGAPMPFSAGQKRGLHAHGHSSNMRESHNGFNGKRKHKGLGRGMRGKYQ